MIGVYISGGGFMGLGKYLLQDQDAETSERVAWTHTRNCGTDDADRAVRRMASVAISQDALKEAAGIKKGGRKLKEPLAHFVLSWHEDDKPTEEHMRETAVEFLSFIGADHLQALIVAHNDGKPHVHMMLNRIDPHTGLAHKLAYPQKKLSAWAAEYEKKNGQIRCEARLENQAKRAAGQKQKSVKRVPRHLYELQRMFRLEAATNDNLDSFEQVLRDQRHIDAKLKRRGRDLRAAQKRERDARVEKYSEDKATLARLQRERLRKKLSDTLSYMHAVFDKKRVIVTDAAKALQDNIIAAEKKKQQIRHAAEKRLQERFLDLTFIAENKRLERSKAKIDQRLNQGGLRGFMYRLGRDARRDRAKRSELEVRIAGNQALVANYRENLDQKHTAQHQKAIRKGWKPDNLSSHIRAHVRGQESGEKTREQRALRKTYRNDFDGIKARQQGDRRVHDLAWRQRRQQRDEAFAALRQQQSKKQADTARVAVQDQTPKTTARALFGDQATAEKIFKAANKVASEVAAKQSNAPTLKR